MWGVLIGGVPDWCVRSGDRSAQVQRPTWRESASPVAQVPAQEPSRVQPAPLPVTPTDTCLLDGYDSSIQQNVDAPQPEPQNVQHEGRTFFPHSVSPLVPEVEAG